MRETLQRHIEKELMISAASESEVEKFCVKCSELLVVLAKHD